MKECAICGESVDQGLIACPKCGGGLFRTHSKYKESLKGVFVSYSRADLSKARALVDALTAKKVHIWWDQGRIRGGEQFEDQIFRGLENTARVIVLWSRSSVSSHYVLTEATHGLKRKKLLPVFLEDVPLPDVLLPAYSGPCRPPIPVDAGHPFR